MKYRKKFVFRKSPNIIKGLIFLMLILSPFKAPNMVWHNTTETVVEAIVTHPTPIVIEYQTNLTYSFGKNDCSSFIQTIYKTNFNIDLPRTSLQISKLGRTIPIDSIQIGALLFYNRTSRGSPSNTISHVAIYLGNDSILHLVSAGVTIDNVNKKFYKNRLVRIKKLFK